MKIGIISERLNRPLTGVGTYTYNLIKEISKILPQDSFYLIDYTDQCIFYSINKINFGSFVKRFPKKSYTWQLYTQLKLRKNNLDLDIIHSPENASLFVKLQNQKKVVTVHDIIAYIYAEFGFTSFRYKLTLKRTLRTADKIITDSYNTKKDLINYFDIPEQKINVIYLAADEKFKPLDSQKVSPILKKYGIFFPYILYVGGFMKHKNVPILLKAFCKLKKEGINHKLVFTGNSNKVINNIIQKLGLQKYVMFIGYVEGEDLPALYNGADLFVYPSLYEGFGLPPLEAMACGCPVITSNTSSLPEVVGDAGIMFDPYDVDELSNVMLKVLSDNILRKDLIIKGLNRSKMFSWEKCAKDTVNVYYEVCNNTIQLGLK